MAEYFTAWPQFIALILGTFTSEDLTCIAAGLLIRDGSLSILLGVSACFVGIYVGDLGLWLLGRAVGHTVLKWKWIARRITSDDVVRLGQWFDHHSWSMVFAARFLPGTRLPLYVATGALGRTPWKFVLATLLASIVWTPILVLGVALFGHAVIGPMKSIFGTGVIGVLASAILAFAMLHIVRRCSTATGRAQLGATMSRLWRWEFWPAWLFYLPLVPWLAWLSLRYRSFTVWTSANPGIPLGGVVGESKFEILSHLPSSWIIPSFLIAPGDASERFRQLEEAMVANQWEFPIILKPDVSQRGAGVKFIRTRSDAATYLREYAGAVIAQTYHPGPYEAGIFYYRKPGEMRGNIFSITDKHFPHITGDGHSTIEELIHRDSRYRMQASTFLKRHSHQRERVLLLGETLQLTIAGNHCQGTKFCDGSHLVTPELTRRIDEIARCFDGFYFGRFDVRYHNVESFQAGLDLAIVELNGVTSESTNLYDPTRSIFWAYRILFRQWALLYEIGNRNRVRGIEVAGIRDLWQMVRAFYAGPTACPLAD